MRRVHTFLADDVGIKHHLGNSPSVPDIYKYQSPQIAMTVDPPTDSHLLLYIRIAKLAAGMRPEICFEYVIVVLFQSDLRVLRRP